MGINFPSSPAINDIYPTPAVAGVPQYKWDGTAWVAVAGAAQFVLKSGDTMTGDLAIAKSTPLMILNDTGGVVADVRFNRNGGRRWLTRMDGSTESGGNQGSQFQLIAYADDGTSVSAVVLTGNRVEGRLSVFADPNVPLGVATKQYVDAGVRAFNSADRTAYTLVLSDTGKIVALWNSTASPLSLTVPPNSAVAFAVGAEIDLMVTANIIATIVPGAGVSITSEDSKRKLPKIGSCATLVKVTTDGWVLCGSLIA